MRMRSLLTYFSPWLHILKLSGLWLLAGLTACALPASPSASSKPSTPSPRLALASAYYQNGQYRIALDESRKVLAAQPDEPQALGLQGLIYARLNEPILAQRSFLRAEQLAGQDADLAHNHGLFLCEQGRYSAAFQRFDLAVNQPLYADKAKTWWVWGVCAQKSGDESAAQNLWVQSLSLKPGAEPALALARSYQQQKLTQRASEVLATINSTNAATAETLWLGIQWARKNGEFETLQRYALQLQKRFATSSQWDYFQREAYDD